MAFKNLGDCMSHLGVYEQTITRIVEEASTDEDFKWQVVASGKWHKTKSDGAFVTGPKWLEDVLDELSADYPKIADDIYDRMYVTLVEGDEP